MARQISRNRWVNGNRKLAYYPNYSEFAGGYEMGTAIPLGYFSLTIGGKAESLHIEVYDRYHYDDMIETFLETGELGVC
jgi:hypothetical protein